MRVSHPSFVTLLFFLLHAVSSHAQFLSGLSTSGSAIGVHSSSPLIGPLPRASNPEASAPPASEPLPAAGSQRPVEPYPTNYYIAPFSRIGIGGDVSPLGIGIKTAIDLNTLMDARAGGSFFNYNTGRVEVDGFNVYGNFHFASAMASVDVYPWHSIWRLSAGTLFINQNQVSASLKTAPGTSIDLNGTTFYSARTNAATGATPLTGTAALAFNRIKPALTLTTGFGNFISRVDRHWSFPSEFGVAFTGAPTIQVNVAGWACLDEKQTQCSNVADTGSPVGSQFNTALQTKLTKIRKSLNDIQIYPLFSYSVVYRFDTPW